MPERAVIWLHDTYGSRPTPGQEQLASRVRLLAPSLPGFETEPKGIDGPEDVVFWLLDLLRSENLERPALVGCGLGGWMAAEFAVRYPEFLSALVLVGAYGLHVPGALAEDEFALMPPRLRPVLFARPDSRDALFWLPDQEPPERQERTLRARVAGARLAWQFPYSPKLRQRLPRAAVPALVVWGEQDHLVPVAHADAYAAGLPDSRRVIIPNSGHYPYLETPEAFADAVARFLDEVRA
jgi:pimeloyl-ACP methyl ester carboxylesterase